MGMVKLEDGEYGRRAVITSKWRSEMSRYLLANDVLELELNYAKGWRGNDLSFLKELPQLRAFKIIDHFGLPDVEPIHYLHELRALDVQTYCKTPIRFSEFPQLEDCGLEWRPKCESLFSCMTLKNLFVNRLNRMMIGWANYFCLGPVSKAYSAVDMHATEGCVGGYATNTKSRGRAT